MRLKNEVARESSAVVRSVRRVTYAGVAVNVILAVLKVMGGLLCGSQALVADAVHSFSDLVTDFAVIWGVKYWSAPADDAHPYGHGKIEALVSAFIALALVLVAWELAVNAFHSLLDENLTPPNGVAFYVALVSIVVKEILFQITRHTAQKISSLALAANAWHHRSDAISSIPVAIAVLVAYFYPQLAWLDAVGALLVGGFILVVAWGILKPALQELMDSDIDGRAGEVAAAAQKVSAVLAVHRVRVRRCGGAYLADLHVLVPSTLSVAAGHTIGHDVKNAILKAGLDVVDAIIHVEPQDVRAIIALGSNVEPRAEYLQKAVEALKQLPCTHLLQTSEVIETDPVDVPPEYVQWKFLNQVVILETALEPHDFAQRMHAIETTLGRIRTVRNGPRTIDLDLIDFGGIRLNEPELTLPHPRAKERAFVLNPLKELGITLDLD